MNCMGDHSTASPNSFKPFEELDVNLEVCRRWGQMGGVCIGCPFFEVLSLVLLFFSGLFAFLCVRSLSSWYSTEVNACTEQLVYSIYPIIGDSFIHTFGLLYLV